jgi:hypothetical protein
MPDNDQSAGATPAAGGATPPQTPPAQPAATPPNSSTPPTPPATGDGDEPLGPAGIRALESERIARREAAQRASDLEKELNDLKAQSLTDSERAVAEAKAAGKAEATSELHAEIRRLRVESALVGAGINPTVLDLAAGAPEFATLKVNQREVEGLDEAVKAFKKARADLFGKPASDGSADGGAQGDAPPRNDDLEGSIAAHYART